MSPVVEDAELRRRLEERTRRLARPRHDGATAPVVDLVVCEVGGSAVAFEAAWVVEVLPPGAAARLPAGDHLLIGVRNVRGDILAVGDLGRLLDPARPVGRATGPVLVLGGASPLGLALDAVRGMASSPADEVAPAPEGASGLVRGLAPGGLALLDAAAVLGDRRLRTAAGTDDREG